MQTHALRLARRSTTWPDCSAARRQYEEVMHSLVDLADEHPEALQLMPGRTFAGALH